MLLSWLKPADTYLTHSHHPDLVGVFCHQRSGAVLNQACGRTLVRTLPLWQSQDGQGRRDEAERATLEDRKPAEKSSQGQRALEQRQRWTGTNAAFDLLVFAFLPEQASAPVSQCSSLLILPVEQSSRAGHLYCFIFNLDKVCPQSHKTNNKVFS